MSRWFERGVVGLLAGCAGVSMFFAVTGPTWGDRAWGLGLFAWSTLLAGAHWHVYWRKYHGIQHTGHEGTGVPAAGTAPPSTITLGPGAYYFGPLASGVTIVGSSFTTGTTPPRPRVEQGELVKDYAIGFRTWRTDSERLLAAGVTAAWISGWNRAVCLHESMQPGHWHTSRSGPNAECECGFYARPQPQGATCSPTERGSIAGAIQAKGHIVEHGTEGFRAEYARVLALTQPTCIWHAEGAQWRSEHPIEYAQQYGYFAQQELHQVMRSYAGPSRTVDLAEVAKQPCTALSAATTLAQRYNVPLIAPDRIEAYAYEFGQRVCNP